MNDSEKWSDLLQDDNVELAKVVQEVSECLQDGDLSRLKRVVNSHAQYVELLHELLPTIQDLQGFAKSTPLSDGDESTAIANGTTLGDFRIVRELGRGGMGIVYEAHQLSLSRKVALKVLPLASLLDSRHLRRFTNEAKAAAILKHPAIVSVHGVGCERGVHYYAMELVEGQTLAQIIQELNEQNRSKSNLNTDREQTASVDTSPVAGLSTQNAKNRRADFRWVAKLSVQIAEALHYAHQEGVIHRDIKPSNILVDRDGRPWVTDFGLAKICDGPSLTISGDMLGTIRYMSPEQASGQRILDHRTDIYSLGITIYELLTLQQAFDEVNRQKLLKQVVEERPCSPRKLRPTIPADLETIVLKATEKNPVDRYSTAQQLADDLGYYLEDKAILARRPTLDQRLTKWSRRHKRFVATVAAATAAVLIFITVGATILASRLQGVAAREERVADHERTTRINVQRSKDRIELQAKSIAQLLAGSYVDKAQGLCEHGEVGAGLLWLSHSLRIAPADALDLRQAIRASLAAWHGQLHSLEAIHQHRAKVTAVSFSPDSGRTVTGCSDGSAWIWDVSASEPAVGPLTHVVKQRGEVTAVAFSPDGKRILTACDGTTRQWNAVSGESVGRPNEHGEFVDVVAYSPNGTKMLTASKRTLRLWESSTGITASAYDYGDGWPLAAAAFTTDGLRVLRQMPGGYLQLWDPVHSRSVGKPTAEPPGIVWSAAIFKDLSRFAIGSANQNIEVWDVQNGTRIGRSLQHGSTVWTMALSSDDSYLLGSAMDTMARVWELKTEETIGQPLEHQGLIRDVAFSADGLRMATASEDGTARVWKSSLSEPLSFSLNDSTVNRVDFHPDGTHLAYLCSDRTGYLLDISTGHKTVIDHNRDLISVAFTVDGSQVVTGCADKTVRHWDITSERPIGQPETHQGWIHTIANSPDGRYYATGSTDKTAQLWDANRHTRVGQLMQHSGEVIRASFSPDGSYLLTGCSDGTAQLWDVNSQEPIGETTRAYSKIWVAAFSPDGTRILLGSENGRVLIADVKSGLIVGQAIQHKSGLRTAAFNLDGSLILTGGLDGMVRIWDASTGKPVGRPLRYGEDVYAVGFDSSRGRVFATGEGGQMVSWPAPPPSMKGDEDRIELWLQVITGLELDLDSAGRVNVLDNRTWHARKARLAQLGGPPR